MTLFLCFTDLLLVGVILTNLRLHAADRRLIAALRRELDAKDRLIESLERDQWTRRDNVVPLEVIRRADLP